MNAKELTTLVEQQGVLIADLVAKCNELEQRSENYAARMNARNAQYRAQFAALFAQPAKPLATKLQPTEARISRAAWDEATAARGVR